MTFLTDNDSIIQAPPESFFTHQPQNGYITNMSRSPDTSVESSVERGWWHWQEEPQDIYYSIIKKNQIL